MPYRKNRDFHTLIDQVTVSVAQGLPCCIYRKPGEKLVTGVFQSDDTLNYAVTFEERGFVFAPFDLNDKAFVITPDKIINTNFEPTESVKNNDFLVQDVGKNFHLDLVEKGISAINKGVLKKVVLSRKIDIKISKEPSELFEALLELYPNALCYLFFHPKLGTWCGATPETLVYINDLELRTMSLAATAIMQDSVDPEWGSKEIEEQQMVTDYIGQKLRPYLDEVYVGSPKSVEAGKLWHLKSKISGKMASNTTIKEVIEALHPTPAVCGIPTQQAKNFIQKEENYQRTFYTGFLGELNLTKNKEATLFVNLRCMEVYKEKASIFVGGGITGASIPENEWSETQHKSITMLRIT
ncbi:MAG: chorismate-binding protein [Flavobacteriaceae bacterium]